MMLEEYTVEDAMTLIREESREEGIELGIERGREEGIELGIERGLERGRGQDIRNLIAFGMTPEQVSEALRLPLETVMRYL
jgi:predicted transposase YdaD